MPPREELYRYGKRGDNRDCMGSNSVRHGYTGNNTAESLLNTVYFYKSKLFGLRFGEHGLIRLSNIVGDGQPRSQGLYPGLGAGREKAVRSYSTVIITY